MNFRKSIEKNVEFAQGVNFNITVTLEHIKYHEDADYWEGKTEENVDKWLYSCKYVFSMNGKTDEAEYYDYEDIPKYRSAINLPDDVRASVFCRKIGVKIHLKKETNDKIRNVIAEAKSELETEESRTYFDAEKEKARENEIKELKAELAKRILIKERSEVILKKNGRLMSNAEVKDYMIGLNNVLNEGGEGYLPPAPPSQEDYDYAQERIEEINKKLE